MKSFKSYISENYDVYLDMPHTKKFRALITMVDNEGKEHNFPIGSDDNVREAAHKTIKGLTDKGLKLKGVDYEF
jgi:hypothetical protein